jgi:hypothetical protein
MSLGSRVLRLGPLSHPVDVDYAFGDLGQQLGGVEPPERSLRSAISSVFQMTAVAFSTRLNRLAAVVRSRTAANGDSIGFVSGMKEEPSPRCMAGRREL